MSYKAPQRRSTRDRVAAKSTDADPGQQRRTLDMLFDDALSRDRECFLAQFSDAPCDGRLRQCHLISHQVLCRELSLRKGHPTAWDSRVWVWGCGGPTGIGGHHGMLDHSRTLRIPRAALPPGLEEFAEETGLVWWLDRTYGPLEQAA